MGFDARLDFTTPAGPAGRYRYSDAEARAATLVLYDLREGLRFDQAVRRHPVAGAKGYVSKSALVSVYRDLVDRGEIAADADVLASIRMKPGRTLSGVTTVTVLTKPFPCPGRCVFCPTDARMPKSYLADEPGAMRALHHQFDPYAQTDQRCAALANIGHPTDKIELLVLGGTFSTYPRDYQEWFVHRCFDALNGERSDSLPAAQRLNESAPRRNVGLVVETRPDHVTGAELTWFRHLGVTKVQMGLQSADDEILARNKRGHDVEATRAAMTLLRNAGFKVVLHWMPNLLGATLASDRADFARIFADPGLRPDELKIYPCQLLANTELHEHWRGGEYTPYTTDELTELLADIKVLVPRYCRVNRVIRDIPSPNVVEGNRFTNLRQVVHAEMRRRGTRCDCIRCREVRARDCADADLVYAHLEYETRGTVEHFVSCVTPADEIAGYLRVSVATSGGNWDRDHDLHRAALVREVHVLGQSLEVGVDATGAAQHSGIGTELMRRAEAIAAAQGFGRVAVIAACGTRAYYRRLGYDLADTYMVKTLADT